MTVDEQWSCQVTNDLSNAIMKPSERLHSNGENTRLSRDIPGILLSIAGTPAAAIGIQQEPDHTLSLSCPVFFDDQHSDVLHARLLELLLTTAETEAAAVKCTRIRYLESTTEAKHRPWVQNILQSSGFSIVAQIAPWTFTAPLSSAAASSCLSITSEPGGKEDLRDRYETFPAASIQSSTERFDVLCSLLRSILRDSDDLSQMPPAEAECLLKDWRAENALIVLVHRGQVAVSLCACVFQTESVIAETVDIQLRYLGVHPKFRRRKIASHLLNHLPSILKASLALPTENFRLTAFGDLSNEAATAMYAACGFARGELSVIWQCGLEPS